MLDFFFVAFEDFLPNPLLQTRDKENDEFIDQMALGKLLMVQDDGSVQAGSLEGLVAQLIQVTSTQSSPISVKSVIFPMLE